MKGNREEQWIACRIAHISFLFIFLCSYTMQSWLSKLLHTQYSVRLAFFSMRFLELENNGLLQIIVVLGFSKPLEKKLENFRMISVF